MSAIAAGQRSIQVALFTDSILTGTRRNQSIFRMELKTPPQERSNRVKRGVELVVGASAGGHANELDILLSAAKGLWPMEPEAYVTTLHLAAAAFARHGKAVYVIGEGDRRKPFRALLVAARTLLLALKLRPRAVVTTGSMPLAIFCIWSKLLGAKIVWVDSVAQVEHMSLSGRVMRHVADLCLVQWPEVAALHGGVEYSGEVL